VRAQIVSAEQLPATGESTRNLLVALMVVAGGAAAAIGYVMLRRRARAES
jgi:LPXTG-motif cell wall-anchored protein